MGCLFNFYLSMWEAIGCQHSEKSFQNHSDMIYNSFSATWNSIALGMLFEMLVP